MSSTTDTPRTSPLAGTRRVSPVRVAVATGAGLVLNLVALWIGSANGATLEIDAPEPINALTVAISTVLPMALGAYVVALVARRKPAFQALAAWLGAGFAVLTAAMPFVASDDVATSITLAVMHVVVGFAWFAAVRPSPSR